MCSATLSQCCGWCYWFKQYVVIAQKNSRGLKARDELLVDMLALLGTESSGFRVEWLTP
jgi:hypothetical protein